MESTKRIPQKMETEMEDISLDYRIYFNKLKPIIYTSVVDDHIELSIRFLRHKTTYFFRLPEEMLLVYPRA